MEFYCNDCQPPSLNPGNLISVAPPLQVAAIGPSGDQVDSSDQSVSQSVSSQMVTNGQICCVSMYLADPLCFDKCLLFVSHKYAVHLPIQSN